MIPNLSAEIIPHESIADITLGLDFEHFTGNSKYQLINNYSELESTYSKKDKWLVLHRNEVLPWGDPIHEIHCFWNKIITLIFNFNTKKLEFIYAGPGYQGKLLALLGIGDRLDSVKDQYNFYFEGDKNYLEYKEDTDKAGELVPVEIDTNYRTAYSEEYNDQIIEGFLVYLLPEERGHLT